MKRTFDRQGRSPSTSARTAGRSGARNRQGAGHSPVGSEIVEALEEVKKALNSNEPLNEHFTVHTYRVNVSAREYGPGEVKAVRELLELSQPLFARFLGVDAETVRSWEKGIRTPSKVARRFMDEISANPAYWRSRLQEYVG
jgi:putative transcriptional regulator